MARTFGRPWLTQPSPHDDILINVEAFRGAIRKGNWKLIKIALLPGKTELFDLSEGPGRAEQRRGPVSRDCARFGSATISLRHGDEAERVDQSSTAFLGAQGKTILIPTSTSTTADCRTRSPGFRDDRDRCLGAAGGRPVLQSSTKRTSAVGSFAAFLARLKRRPLFLRKRAQSGPRALRFRSDLKLVHQTNQLPVGSPGRAGPEQFDQGALAVGCIRSSICVGCDRQIAGIGAVQNSFHVVSRFCQKLPARRAVG